MTVILCRKRHQSLTVLEYYQLVEEESLNVNNEYQSLDGRSVLGASVAQTG